MPNLINLALALTLISACATNSGATNLPSSSDRVVEMSQTQPDKGGGASNPKPQADSLSCDIVLGELEKLVITESITPLPDGSGFSVVFTTKLASKKKGVVLVLAGGAEALKEWATRAAVKGIRLYYIGSCHNSMGDSLHIISTIDLLKEQGA